MSYTNEQLETACRTLIPNYDPWAGADAYYFDVAAAQRAIQFIEEVCTFTNAKWAGKRYVLGLFQVAMIGNLFGWKRKSDHLRRYRRTLWFMAQKMGKTELAGATANFLLHCDGESAPEIVCAAGNAEQAEKIFRAASQMVLNEPELASRSELFKRAINSKVNGGFIKVINSESRTKFGGNIHAALIDELHIHRDANLVDVLETSQKARSQPLTIFTTTAGQITESIAYEIYDYACKVRDGIIIDHEFLPVVFEAPKDADITKVETWKMASPNLGVTVPVEDYERQLKKAQEIPRFMFTFKQLCLNQWVEESAAWIGIDDWKACAGTFTLEQFKGCKAAIGIDLSSTTDTTAVTTVIESNGKHYAHADIFLPKDNAEGRFRRQKRDKAPYLLWISQGHIRATEGNTVDYQVVEDRIIELSKLFSVIEVQADPYNASGLLERLQKAGLPVTMVRQGWTLAESTKECERMILARELVHDSNPAFSFQVASASVKTDDRDNVWITKARSVARVDAVIGLVEAINAVKFGKGRDAVATDCYYSRHPELIVL